MEQGLVILMILCILIFIIAITLIIVINYRNKIKSLTYRMDISSEMIKDNLKNKFDIVTRMINIIERELKIESKKFEAVKKINNEKTNNVKFDNILSDASEEILEIKDDYKEIEKVKSFKGLANDLKDLDILLSGSKKFYNKYASLYNSLVRKFPYKFFKNKYKYKELYIEEDETFENLDI